MSWKSLGRAWAHRPLEYFSSSSSSFSLRSGLKAAGEDGGLGDEEEDTADWGEWEPERVKRVLGGLCWAGGGEDLSEGTFEVGKEGEVDFGLAEGKVDNIVDCSLAG